MRKRKAKAHRYACPHCESLAVPEKARTRAGMRCKRCPDCRGQVIE
jgi:ssDNA-binding Zn-finger/Zn-ribbon topoisomerase 1